MDDSHCDSDVAGRSWSGGNRWLVVCGAALYYQVLQYDHDRVFIASFNMVAVGKPAAALGLVVG